jgi:hypothetical protein
VSYKELRSVQQTIHRQIYNHPKSFHTLLAIAKEIHFSSGNQRRKSLQLSIHLQQYKSDILTSCNAHMPLIQVRDIYDVIPAEGNHSCDPEHLEKELEQSLLLSL